MFLMDCGCNLIIQQDVDDEPPVFPAGQEFTIPDSAANGYTVGTVVATDNVGVSSFTIVSGDPAGIFSIGSGGVLTVADNTTLAVGDYVLGIEVEDYDTNTTTGSVTVHVVFVPLLYPPRYDTPSPYGT